MKNTAIFMLALFACADAMADSTSSQASSISSGSGYGYGGSASSLSQGGNGFGGMGGAGGIATSISQGGVGGAGGHGGDATGGNGGEGTGGAAYNSGSGNAQNLNFDQPRQSPAVFMYAPAPTAPCQSSMGGFLSFVGGAGFAYSQTLDNCEVREEARVAYGIGQPGMAKEIMCMGKYAKQTSECKEYREKE